MLRFVNIILVLIREGNLNFALSFILPLIMRDLAPIKSALISVFDKTGLDILLDTLVACNVQLYSTGGTLNYIQSLGLAVTPVENLTSFPEILGGRVKTLHPGVFGGILYQRGLDRDEASIEEHKIQSLDMVVVDLYPFEKTVNSTTIHADIIEKIDIGGVSLLRAAAKNHQDVVVVSNRNQYIEISQMLKSQNGETLLSQRQHLALQAFRTTSSYDNAIQKYFEKITQNSASNSLRYGENPHQSAHFEGRLEDVFTKLSGKELSYNNLLDVDAAVRLMHDFGNTEPVFAIIKHNNACGIAVGSTLHMAYERALAADPISAFGGILISNQNINLEVADTMNDLFFEILIAPGFDEGVMSLLCQKKNRILLLLNANDFQSKSQRTLLNGSIIQDFDQKIVSREDLKVMTKREPSKEEIEDLLFANLVAKHTKSNAISLVKNKQLLASGTGQTSRVDALKQAIEKAKSFGFELKGAVMASDAFFPFPDCVAIANEAGIQCVIQPGGSVKDQLSIDYCNGHQMAMVFTGFRHFKH